MQSTTHSPTRKTKGSVSIKERSGRLYLRLPRQVSPKQAEIPTGLSDTPDNRKLAAAKAKEIEADIVYERFDYTLEKYRPKRHLQVVKEVEPEEQIELKLQDLWGQYFEYKKSISKPTTVAYLESCCGTYLKRCPISDYSKALDVRQWLLNNTTNGQAKRTLVNLNAAVKWGIKNRLIDAVVSPYEGMASELPKHKYEKEPEPNAFTQEEKQRILDTFERHQGTLNKQSQSGKACGNGYNHYFGFVRFMFLTGCRPSEAIGLQWRQINNDCSQIIFDTAIVKVGAKSERVEGSKNNKSRKFNCSPSLQELLLSIKPEKIEPEALVFPAPKGGSIDYRNFSRRAWDKIVDPIIDRPTTPYSCRDTFITEQVAKGVPTAVVARWCDNSVGEIEKRYLDNKALEQLRPLD